MFGIFGIFDYLCRNPRRFVKIQEFIGIAIFWIFEIFENLGSRREEQSGEVNTCGGFSAEMRVFCRSACEQVGMNLAAQRGDNDFYGKYDFYGGSSFKARPISRAPPNCTTVTMLTN